MGTPWIRVPERVSGTSMPGRSLPRVCVLSHFADGGISHAFNVVVPIYNPPRGSPWGCFVPTVMVSADPCVDSQISTVGFTGSLYALGQVVWFPSH